MPSLAGCLMQPPGLHVGRSRCSLMALWLVILATTRLATAYRPPEEGEDAKRLPRHEAAPAALFGRKGHVETPQSIEVLTSARLHWGKSKALGQLHNAGDAADRHLGLGHGITMAADTHQQSHMGNATLTFGGRLPGPSGFSLVSIASKSSQPAGQRPAAGLQVDPSSVRFSELEVEQGLSTLANAVEHKNLQVLISFLASAEPTWDANGLCMRVVDATSVSLLQALALKGWHEGALAFLQWNSRRKAGASLRVNDAGPLGTALTCAIQVKAPKVVTVLAGFGASALARDAKGFTPLEVAAKIADADVLAALLNFPELQGGMARLQIQLANETANLPSIFSRLDSQEDLMSAPMQKLQSVMPLELHPPQKDLSLLGEMPHNWLLHYKNCVMRALAVSRAPSKDISEAEVLLVSQGFANFFLDHSVTVVALTTSLAAFGLYVYIIVELRIYGSMEAPISLSHLLVGAFTPVRLADADFDPSRQQRDLPYRSMLGIVACGRALSLLSSLSVFFCAIVGHYSAWALQSIRIPPEKDPHDEDYLSDDDDERRLKVRESAATRARRAHSLEVVGRFAALITLVWWLCIEAHRYREAAMLIATLLLFAIAATVTAGSAVPAPTPEQAPNDCEDEDVDSAMLTYAVFQAQHGPRWTRSLTSTRSTATPSVARSKLLRKPRRKGAKLPGDKEEGTTSAGERSDVATESGRESVGAASSSAAAPSMSEPGSAPPAEQEEVLEPLNVPIPLHLQQPLIKGGYLHIRQKSFLPWAIFNLIVVFIVLLWLTHARVVVQGAFRDFYNSLRPLKLFEVYGPPRTFQRWTAVSLELGFLAFVGDRLYALADFLVAATLTLHQRQRALGFACQQPPLAEAAPVEEKEGILLDMIRVLDECSQCVEFMLELSTARWQIMRLAVLWLYVFVVGCYCFVLAFLLLAHVQDKRVQVVAQHVDLAVPASIAMVFTVPSLACMWAAASANSQVAGQQKKLRQHVDAIRNAMSNDEKNQVQHVRLRLKAAELLVNGFLQWPGGRDLGFKEPLLLCALTLGTLAAAIFLQPEGIPQLGIQPF